MSRTIRIFLLAAGLTLASGALFAQAAASTPKVQSSAAASSSAKPAELSASLNKASGRDSSKAPAQVGESRAIENSDEEAEENSQFKYSSAVRAVAAKTGLSKEAVYWIFLLINFAILAAGLVWVVRKTLPHGFAPRTAEIQKGIEDARKVSAEASARLAEIESRLAKLDSEIAAVRTAAEADFSVEEQRIKAAAEQDARNVITAAEQEIAAAARAAQRELKSFVAGLAVDLAEKKINVDDATDQALVHGFAAQLGKDGQ
jgi:F-type H+-transporting ATPase subunit b